MSKQAGTYFIEEVWERYPKKEVDRIGHGIRGIYVLLEEKDVEGETKYNVIYIGLSTTGMRGGRLTGHAESKSKEWTHFSAYKVFDNITDEQIKELEGLFRTIFFSILNTLPS